MKWIIVLLCCLGPGLACGQGFSFTELQKMLDMDWAHYKKLVTGRGYLLEKDKKDRMDHEIVYALGETSNDEHKVHPVNHIVKQVGYDAVETNPEEVTLTFVTYNQNEVDLIKKQLETSKYKLVRRKRQGEILTESDWEVYEGDRTEINIISARAQSGNPSKETSPFPYQIKIVKQYESFTK